MSNYTPESPTPTPVPCEGQPWRAVEDTIECLTALPQTGHDNTVELALALVAVILVAVGLIALNVAVRKAERK